jgi:hypothetical protein
MSTITHHLRRLRCFSILLLVVLLAAAATSAFAQAPNCSASPGPACLYVSPSSHGFAAFERHVHYIDKTGAQRLVKLLLRQPLGAAGPMPVVVWSHGGAEGKQDPATSMAEWSTLILVSVQDEPINPRPSC